MGDTHHSSVPPSKAGGGDHDNTRDISWDEAAQMEGQAGLHGERESSPTTVPPAWGKAENPPAVQLHGSWALGPFFSVSVSRNGASHFHRAEVKQARWQDGTCTECGTHSALHTPRLFAEYPNRNKDWLSVVDFSELPGH